jgi:hypothetical protein
MRQFLVEPRFCCRSLLLAAASIAALSILPSGAASAACTGLGGTVSTWTGAHGANWVNNPSNWTGGTPGGSSDSACIALSSGTVNLNAAETIDNLQLATNNSLDITNQTLTMDGTALINAGTINLSYTGGSAAVLDVSNNLLLSGGGTVSLSYTGSSGTNARLSGTSSSFSLTNQNNLIEGGGFIGGAMYSFTNQAQGTVLGNLSAETLSLVDIGTFTNAGLVEANVGSVVISNDGTISNSGTLEATNGGTLSIENSMSNAGGLIEANGGAVNIGLTGKSFEIDGGTLQTLNGGTMQTVAGATETLNGVTVASGSTYLTGSTATTNLEGTITNQGTLAVTAGASNATLGLTGNVILNGGGTVALSTTGAGAASIQGGTNSLTNNGNLIEGSGQIVANLFNYGTVKPGGASAGTLTISGNYTQGINGTLDIELGGTGSGQYSQLTVLANGNSGGMATVDGTLAINLINGFSLAAGQEFYILTAQKGITGNFDAFEFDGTSCTEQGNADTWDCANLGKLEFVEAFLNGNHYLRLDIVPEPDSVALLGTGLLVAAATFRRRRKIQK